MSRDHLADGTGHGRALTWLQILFTGGLAGLLVGLQLVFWWAYLEEQEWMLLLAILIALTIFLGWLWYIGSTQVRVRGSG